MLPKKLKRRKERLGRMLFLVETGGKRKTTRMEEREGKKRKVGMGREVKVGETDVGKIIGAKRFRRKLERGRKGK